MILKASEINFANAFAANDPVSTKMLWDKLYAKYQQCDKKVLIVNCRNDREDRSKQIAEAILEWDTPDLVTLIGTGTGVFVSFYKKYAKTLNKKTASIIVCEDMQPEEILDEVSSIQKDSSYLLVGVGNIKDIGLSLVDFCDQSHKQKRNTQ